MRSLKGDACESGQLQSWPLKQFLTLTISPAYLQVTEKEFEDDLVCFLEATGEDRLAKNVRGRHIGW